MQNLITDTAKAEDAKFLNATEVPAGAKDDVDAATKLFDK